MKIKDQIRSKRELMRMSMEELAKKTQVSEQAVRHWESGRSYPGKKRIQLIELALSLRIDWTEGAGGSAKTAAEQFDEQDLELLQLIRRLPEPVKRVIGDLARSHLEALNNLHTLAHERSGSPKEADASLPPSRTQILKS